MAEQKKPDLAQRLKRGKLISKMHHFTTCFKSTNGKGGKKNRDSIVFSWAPSPSAKDGERERKRVTL